MSDEIDVAKLKLPELRAELSKRGLNTFGTRQVLLDRLSEALSAAAQSSIVKDSQAIDADEPPCIVSPVKSSSQENTEQSFRNGKSTGAENGVFDQNMDVDSRQRSDADAKRKRSSSRSPRRRSRSKSRDRDRDSRRSPRRRSRSPTSKNKICDEPDGWEKSQDVFLDGYNCDLNLIVSADGFSARPQTDGGFSMMWAGIRANYGIVHGRAFFEVRVARHLPVENLDSVAGGAAHVMRVGWSTENSEFALGEEPQSYGYGGTGKKSCDNKFLNYGCTFGEGDVVGAFLDYKPHEAIMRFSVNGVDQGECFRVPRSTFSDSYALFPHVYVKNVEFMVNFGQNDQPAWFAPNIPGDNAPWNLMNNVGPALKVHGRLPPASKSECEVIMMIGLPGAGKTYYAEQLRKARREKQYNVLGTNLILDKMKVMGLARQRNYHGRWDVLIDKATKCLNVLISIASMRRRNYILDQTNVYPSAQRRKMRPFEGFKRQAIVIVPTDEEFRRRIAQREKEEGKEVPESAVLEMKANFGIPKPLSEDHTSVFDDVIFTELNSSEARDLVQKYNDEGQANRPPPEKRQRWDGSSRDRESSGSRDSRFHGGHDRDYSHGRRDDYRRSPNRRDDRGRRDYRGGYSAERDRSRESDRFDRGRDRESYGRRFGGPGGPAGRFGGPPNRGGYPPNMGPSGGYMGYDGPQGGMMMRGGPGRGGPPGGGMGRGGYGSPSFDSAGGPPMDFRGEGRPPRGGRGGFRGGPQDHSSGQPDAYAGSMDTGYGGRPSRFDSPSGKPEIQDTYSSELGSSVAVPGADVPPPMDAASGAAGYQGGYGGPPNRGAYGPPGGRGSYGPPEGRGGGSFNQAGGQQPARGGTGGPPRGALAGRGDRDSFSMGRGGGPVGRGGRGGRGGYQSDSESGSGYPAQGPDSSQYSRYPGGSSDNYPSNPSGYSTGDDYSNTGRDRFGPSGTTSYPGPEESVTPESASYQGSSGYSGGYQKSGYPGGDSYTSSGQTGYSRGEYPTQSGGYAGTTGGYPTNPPMGSFSGPGSDTYSGSGGRSGGDTRRSGTQPAATSAYGSNDNDKSAPGRPTGADTGSLYASGAARFGDRPPTQGSGPRQSRFDDKPSNVSTQQPYSNYQPGSYQGGSYGTYGGATNPPPPSAPTGPRGGRSRFDVGPGSGQPVPPSASGPSTGSAASNQSTAPQSTGMMQRFGDRPPTQGSGPRQSRFDDNPSNVSTQQPYSNYQPGSYQGGSYGTYGGATNPPPPSAPTGPRSGRSRSDVGPGSGQPVPPSASGPSTGSAASNQSTAPQSTGMMQQQASQAYGYNYPPPASKSDSSSGQPGQQQSAYSSYGYGYGYGSGSYGAQGATSAGSQSRPVSGSGGAGQSLYASAVAQNPQQSSTVQSAGATNPSASSNAAYASYYGYGAQNTSGSAATTATPSAAGQTAKYDAAMAAAQQFNSWQQQPVASSVSATSSTTAPTVTPAQTSQGAAAASAGYASYYPGYAAYGNAYGATPPTTGATPVSSASSAPQYYAGYR